MDGLILYFFLFEIILFILVFIILDRIDSKTSYMMIRLERMERKLNENQR